MSLKSRTVSRLISSTIQLREERKAELERHVQEVNALLRPLAAAGSESGSGDHDDSDGSEGWGGIEEAPPPIDHEAEYIDEDRYTTVTVEEMDLSKEGIYKAEQTAARAEDGNAIPDGEQEGDGETKATKRIWTKERPKDGVRKPKKKKAKFRYESKAERKQTRAKQRAKNSKQAKARREQ